MSSEADKHKDQFESDLDALVNGVGFVELWLTKIEAARAEEKDWREQADNAIKVYESDESVSTPYNVLFSNGQVLLPALYNSPPVPDVRRRHDSGGPVEKMVVDIIERTISTELDQYDFDSEMRAVVRDSYVAGRGVCRIRYEAQVNETTIEHQAVRIEALDWDRFVRGPAMSWATMPWVAQIHDMTKEQLAALAPDIDISKIATGNEKAGEDKPNAKGAGVLKTTRVFEVWDKSQRAVYFICEKYKDQPLKVMQDPIGLSGFFPFLKPLQPTTRVSSLTPLVPYEAWKSQANELNKITNRINSLIGQLKVRGLYDARLEQDFGLLRTCEDGEYIAAKDATQFAQGSGGLESAIAHWPFDQIVAALQQLYVQRAETKGIIDQISGVADILRGEVDPNEKLGQTQIKQQAGSIRITDWQNEIARMARDIFRAKAEIYSRHYQPQTLSIKSGLPQMDPMAPPEQQQQSQQMFQAAIQQLKGQLLAFIIDIETDSTIRADMTRNQEQMNQFLAGTGQFVQGMVAAGQALPPLIPTMVEVYTAFARKFKLGKQAEDALDQLPMQVQQAMQQMQSQPNPEQQKAEQEQARMQAEDEREAKRAQREDEKAQREEQRAERMHAREMQRMDQEDQYRASEAEMKRGMAESDMEHKREMNGFERERGEREMGKGQVMKAVAELAADVDELRQLVAALVQEHQAMNGPQVQGTMQ